MSKYFIPNKSKVFKVRIKLSKTKTLQGICMSDDGSASYADVLTGNKKTSKTTCKRFENCDIKSFPF